MRHFFTVPNGGKLNTFLYLGGAGTLDQKNLPGGFATTIKSLYIGAYYGGTQMTVGGDDDGADANTVKFHGELKNNFVLLVGNLSFGALRLDVFANSTSDEETLDGEFPSTRKGDLTTVVTWDNNFGKLMPHVSLGFM
jgi:hypothetical protein